MGPIECDNVVEVPAGSSRIYCSQESGSHVKSIGGKEGLLGKPQTLNSILRSGNQ